MIKEAEHFKVATDDSSETPHAEGEVSVVTDFFDQHGKFLEKYAGDSSIRIEPAPPRLGTFAIDLEKGVMYAEPKFFTEKGYSLDKAMFATLHEFEHFREMRELLSEPGGERIWQKHRDKSKAKRRLHILDNCFDDIKMNRQVLERAPVLSSSRDSLYRENLFAATDYQDQPKHLQFAYGLLRRAMLPGEEMVLSLEVQAEIDKLEAIESGGVKVLEYASRPDTPMSMRLKLQERFLEPIYEKFFQEDVEEKKNNGSNPEGGENGEGGEPSDSNADSGGQDSSDSEGQPSKAGKPSKSKPKKASKDGNQAGTEQEPVNPEDYFKDEYDKHDAANSSPIDYDSPEIEQEIEKYLKEQQGKSVEQEAIEAYAKAEGVSLGEIRQYQNFFDQLEKLENPETGEAVLEELRAIFKKIISERKKDRYAPKHPMSEGEVLIRPAEAVAAVMSGENEPEVWETLEKKNLPQELFGDFDVTLVCDRSGSMDGNKAIEQRKAAVLLLEALKDFCDELEEMRSELKHDLNVRSEVWGFGGEAEVKMLKPLSDQLTEKQRVSVYKDLADTPGDSTMDFLALERIKGEVTDEEWQKIKDKKLCKVIIVLTDGDSDSAARVQKTLHEFRDAGVAVAAIGVTASGKSAEKTYAPNGQVCENAGKLAVVLGDLLKDYLRDLLIKR